MGSFVNVTYENDSDSDSDPDGRIGDDFHAERSVHTSAASGGVDGDPPGCINIGIGIGAGGDGHEAEITC